MSNNIISNILTNYSNENLGVQSNLYRLLMQGALAGTGKMIILPVDQGFEHGPARSFSMNSVAYDPDYHLQLAIDGQLNAYAAPLGMLEAASPHFAGQIPLILKINSGVCTHDGAPDQAVTASVDDALRLGCIGIGYTIYPGSSNLYRMLEDLRELTREAKAKGLLVIVWSYPRGETISKDGETALDVVTYGAHIAALMGAHIIKVKLPSAHIELDTNQPAYAGRDLSRLASRVKHVVECCFQGKRLIIFSGGVTKDTNAVLDDMRAIYQGGGNGSIIGRNSFQKPRAEALQMFADSIKILKGF